MAYMGAQGKTAAQMKTAMHLTDFNNEKISAVVGSLCRSLKVFITSWVNSLSNVLVFSKIFSSKDFSFICVSESLAINY